MYCLTDNVTQPWKTTKNTTKQQQQQHKQSVWYCQTAHLSTSLCG